MKNTALLFTLVNGLSLIYGATNTTICNSNKCYQSVNNSLENLMILINRLNSTCSTAKIPETINFEQIRKDINVSKDIEEKSKNIEAVNHVRRNINKTNQNILTDQKKVDHMFEKLSNISQSYNNSAKSILGEARNRLTEFEKLRDFAENVSKTCEQTSNKYAEFENILKNLTKDYNDIKNRANTVNNDVNQTFQETVEIKKNVDNIELPLNAVGDYVSGVENNLNNTISLLKNNSNLLKEILADANEKWNAQITRKAEELIKRISEIQDDVDVMNKELIRYEEALNQTFLFNPTVNEDSKKMLGDFKKDIETLEQKLKSIDFSEEIKLFRKFSEEINKNRLLLKEFNLLLDAMPNKEKLKYIEKEIRELRITIRLVAELNRLREQLELLRKYDEEISKVNCTTFTTSTGLT